MATTTTTPGTTTTTSTTAPASTPAGTSTRRGWFDAIRKAFRSDASDRTDLQRRISSYPPSRSAATLFLPYE